jgi:hypothetical protein
MDELGDGSSRILMFLSVAMALMLGFIGLYAGSMLRRPVKS